MLMTAGSNGAVLFLDALSGKEIERCPAPQGIVERIVHAPHGRALAALEAGSRSVGLWDLQSGLEVLRLELDAPACGTVAFSPDGFLLAVASVRGWVQIWDIAEGGLVGRIEEPELVRSLAFSPDGRALAVGLHTGAVEIWSLTPDPGKNPTWTEDMQIYWADLVGGDVRRAFRAMDRLVSLGDKATEFLRTRLQVPAGIEEQVSTLIKDLDNDDDVIREKAAKDLSEIGPFAEPALRQAIKAAPTAEAQVRLTHLIHALDRHVDIPPGHALGRARAIRVLDRIGSPAARELLSQIAEGSPSERERRTAREAHSRQRNP
jgi:hypothetical protein